MTSLKNGQNFVCNFVLGARWRNFVREALVVFLTRKHLGRTKKREGGVPEKKHSGEQKKGATNVFSCLFVHDVLEVFFCVTPPSVSSSWCDWVKGWFSPSTSGSFLQTWAHPSRRTKSEAPKSGHMVYMEATSVSSSSLCVFFVWKAWRESAVDMIQSWSWGSAK